MQVELEHSREHTENEIRKLVYVKSNGWNESYTPFDIVFINELVNDNSTKYYRLFIRPNLSRTEFKNRNTNKLWFVGEKISNTKISSFIQITCIKDGKKNVIIDGLNKALFKNFYVEQYDDGRYATAGNDFIQIKIPEKFIEQGKITTFSYNTLYNLIYDKNKPHVGINSTGNIIIDTTQSIDKYFDEEESTIDIYNYVGGFMGDTYSSTGNYSYENIVSKQYLIINKSYIHDNKIVPQYLLKKVVNSSGVTINLGDLLFNYLQLLANNILSDSNPVFETSINIMNDQGITESDKKYYNIAKPKYNTISEGDGILIANDFNTVFDKQTGLIVDNEFEENGLLLNPNIKGKLILKHKLKISGDILDIKNEVDVDEIYNGQISYTFENQDLTLFSLINFNIDEFDFNNIASLEYIKEFLIKNEKIS